MSDATAHQVAAAVPARASKYQPPSSLAVVAGRGAGGDHVADPNLGVDGRICTLQVLSSACSSFPWSCWQGYSSGGFSPPTAMVGPSARRRYVRRPDGGHNALCRFRRFADRRHVVCAADHCQCMVGMARSYLFLGLASPPGWYLADFHCDGPVGACSFAPMA